MWEFIPVLIIIGFLFIYLGYNIFVEFPQQRRQLDNDCELDCLKMDHKFLQRTREGCFCFDKKNKPIKIWEL